MHTCSRQRVRKFAMTSCAKTDKKKVDGLFFGLVVGHETELGYFSLKEMEGVSTRRMGFTDWVVVT